MRTKTALIIGAGPAGLTAAYELLTKTTNIQPIVIEESGDIGGISKTVQYKGNRIDIGGHRFFSKSDVVMDWWQNILPFESQGHDPVTITYRNRTTTVAPTHGEGGNPDAVFLVRHRLSRIFFSRTFFAYPLALNLDTIRGLGIVEMVRIGMSYLYARVFPRKPETSLEDFFINRFGVRLYRTFFKDYTEKVWGVSCSELSAEWGAQRIKGLSITKAVIHMVKSMMPKSASVRQKDVETSLIEQFLYPKLGPGQMWEEVARKVVEMGGEIHLNKRAVGVELANQKTVKSILVQDSKTGENEQFEGDYFFSTMPVKDLIAGMSPEAPASVQSIATNLPYRDFITVGLLMKKLQVSPREKDARNAENPDLISDNWIYIQERDVKIGRLQIFNNWSPAMVKDPNTVWLGLEYFANEGDELWTKGDDEFKKFAAEELERIGIIDTQDVLDSIILRVKKAYPSYFGSYNDFNVVREYLDSIENLFPIGRNGMHRYNNQDHSMLTAMAAVAAVSGPAELRQEAKRAIWDINAEESYHESK